MLHVVRTFKKFIALCLIACIITIVMPHVVRPFENLMYAPPCTMCGVTFHKIPCTHHHVPCVVGRFENLLPCVSLTLL